jgi:hypothetical protein
LTLLLIESILANMLNFNFDEWAELYRIDPTEFERKRSEVLEETIQKAPVKIRNKLRLIQMQCDAVHHLVEPLKAAEEMSKLMLDKVFDLQDSFLDLAIACKDFNEQTRT